MEAGIFAKPTQSNRSKPATTRGALANIMRRPRIFCDRGLLARLKGIPMTLRWKQGPLRVMLLT